MKCLTPLLMQLRHPRFEKLGPIATMRMQLIMGSEALIALKPMLGLMMRLGCVFRCLTRSNAEPTAGLVLRRMQMTPMLVPMSRLTAAGLRAVTRRML